MSPLASQDWGQKGEAMSGEGPNMSREWYDEMNKRLDAIVGQKGETMNLFHCNLHPEGFGTWRSHEYNAVTRDMVKPPAYTVAENLNPNYPFGEFRAEKAQGWFASEAGALSDCQLVRSLAEHEYKIMRGQGRPLASNYILLLQDEGLRKEPCYLYSE